MQTRMRSSHRFVMHEKRVFRSMMYVHEYWNRYMYAYIERIKFMCIYLSIYIIYTYSETKFQITIFGSSSFKWKVNSAVPDLLTKRCGEKDFASYLFDSRWDWRSWKYFVSIFLRNGFMEQLIKYLVRLAIHFSFHRSVTEFFNFYSVSLALIRA